MAALTYLDTHVVLWLYEYGAEGKLLSEAALAAIREASEVRVSPIVRLELACLREIGRSTVPASAVLTELEAGMDLRICRSPFAAVALVAEEENWTRDPFDRLIVAQAALNEAVLVTQDRRIRDNYEQAVW